MTPVVLLLAALVLGACGAESAAPAAPAATDPIDPIDAPAATDATETAADTSTPDDLADVTPEASDADLATDAPPLADETVPDPTAFEASTFPATALGTAAFSANGRVQPHGKPTSWHFEYGPTADYGSVTATKALSPRLAAYYTESWDDGLAGWRGGSGEDLTYVPSGGVSGGFSRFTEPSGTDYNHVDGIGPIHLAQYFYPGTFDLDAPTAALGGGHPDFRDARVTVSVRGNDWRRRVWGPNPDIAPPFYRGDELVWWTQTDVSPGKDSTKFSNWAHTGFFLTAALYSDSWRTFTYYLYNDTSDWSYAGHDRSQGRDVYVYAPLDQVLGDLDVDMFHLLLFVDNDAAIYGSIDFDELTVAYRNHSLVFGSNGGVLVQSPAGAPDDAAALTDGYRHGAGHMWRSAPDPAGPLEFVYDLALPVTIASVQIHNHTEWPSRDVAIFASVDGVTWTSVADGTLPEAAPTGPNFAYLLKKGLAVLARHVKVVIASGYRAEAWGLGEIELFGEGAVMQTDDDWYRVTADITGDASGLVAGTTYHYRMVAVSGDEVARGEDQTFTVPTGETPEVLSGDATTIAPRLVRLAGAINTLGGEGLYHFELGLDATYGHATAPMRTGPEITPRAVTRLIDLGHPDLAALVPGSVVHYRLVLCSGCQTPSSDDDVIHAGADRTFVTE